MKITKRHVIVLTVILLVATLAALEARPTLPGWSSGLPAQLTPPRRDTRWADHLRIVDRALASSDVSLAVRSSASRWVSSILAGEVHARSELDRIGTTERVASQKRARDVRDLA